MAVDFDSFLQWAKDRFGEGEVKIRHTSHGDEIMTHSFYAHWKGIEDNTFNLWMNPSGGKGKKCPEKGSFRCWKTDTMGTLVKLVADYDNIDHEEAEVRICGSSSLRDLEQRVHAFFGSLPEPQSLPPEPDSEVKGVCLPECCCLIDKMSEGHWMKEEMQKYLSGRKLSSRGLYACTYGDYKGRIVIPYFDADDNLIWFNSRLPHDKKDTIKYMKCKADGLLTQEDVLYMTKWPAPGSKVYVMEGEFDAMSFASVGLHACAIAGKFMSDVQIEMLRKYRPVLAFDSDPAGVRALIDSGERMIQKGFSDLLYVRPAKGYKDWNGLLVAKDGDILREFVRRYEKPFTGDTKTLLRVERL